MLEAVFNEVPNVSTTTSERYFTTFRGVFHVSAYVELTWGGRIQALQVVQSDEPFVGVHVV